MKKIKRLSKIIPIILIVSILFTACDIPDISKFTEQSAEMTRGIKQGVKETSDILSVASKRDDLFSSEDISEIRKLHTNYQKTLKPTVKVLESIDSYLEALNALSQANKKSEENSKAAVNAVSELVSAVSGITFAETTINLAAGIVTKLEELRTARAFKRRVELVDEIMNGGDANGNKPCVQDPAGTIRKKIRNKIDNIDPAIRASRLITEAQLDADIVAITNAINKLKAEKEKSQVEAETIKIDAKITKQTENLDTKKEKAEKKIDNLYADRIVNLLPGEKKQVEVEVGGATCGVIDLLKYNIEDLRAIHNSVSKKLYDGTRSKNLTVISYHDSILANDGRVQWELQHILDYKRLSLRLNEAVYFNDAAAKIDDRKEELKDTLSGIFILDSTLQSTVCSTILVTAGGVTTCDASKKIDLNDFKTNFYRYNGKIITLLETRDSQLIDENKRFTADLQRIDPVYKQIIADLKQIKDKQKQMDALFESSGEALDTWAETHANLRVVLNTKKPLTVSRLVSKVKEIWSILEPLTNEQTNN